MQHSLTTSRVAWGIIRAVTALSLALSWVAGQPAEAVKALSFPAQMNKSFTPISIAPGLTSVLSVTIFNPNPFALTDAHYHDVFPAGMSLANPIELTNSCGLSSSVTDDSLSPLVPGGTHFSLNGGTVPAKEGVTNGECTVTVKVTSTTPGNAINTILAGELTSQGDDFGTTVDVTNAFPASATLQVSSVLAPSVNKAFSPSTIWVGQASQLTINIVNNDPVTTLTQTTLTDDLPSPLVLASPINSSLLNCGASATLSGPGGVPLASGQSSVTLNNASVTPGATCRIRVNVTSATQGIYTNTVPAGPGGTGSIQTAQGVTNAAPASASINVQAVRILKAFSPTTFQQGDSSLLTITLQNPTGTDYTGVGLVDSLELIPNLTFVAGTAGTTCPAGTATLSGSPLNVLTFADGTIPFGSIVSPGSCTFYARVTGVTNGTYTNVIPANTMTGPITNVLGVSANVTVQTRAIGVTKSFSPSNFNPGATSTLTITLQNRTSSAYTDVQFTDTLPGAGSLTIAAAPAPINNCGGTLTAVAGTNIIRLGDGTPGTGGTIPSGTVSVPGTCTIIVAVTSSTPGTYPNSIPANTVTSAEGVPSTGANATVVVNGQGPVQLTKSFQSATIAAGASVRLRLVMTAPLDTALHVFSITDHLPTGVTVSNLPAAQFSGTGCGVVGNRHLTAATGAISINLVLDTFAAGTSCTLDVWVTSSTPGTVTNTVGPSDITNSEVRTIAAPVSASLTVTSLSVSKAFFPPTVNPNGLSTLTITLTNTSPVPLTNVQLADILPGTPANGVVVAATPNAGTTCPGGTVTAVAGSQSISMANGAIPSQVEDVPGLCTITVDVQGKGIAATRVNSIQTTNVLATVGDSGPSIRPAAVASANLVIAPLSIAMSKGFNPLTVFGGSASTLSVQLINPNNAALSGIAFTDSMPAGMILASPVNLNVGACGGALSGLPGAGTFSFSGGSLPAAGSCTLTLSATMPFNGNLTNTIAAGAVTTFNGASNPQAASATLTNLPGASVSKSFSPNPILVGDYSLLTITIQNTDTLGLSGMGLVDNLPAGVVIAGGAAPAPENNCDGSLTAAVGTQLIQLEDGILAGSASCTIVVPVTSTVAGNYLNTIPAATLETSEGATNGLPATDSLAVLALASLGDFVWNDLDANGIQDGGESGIDGVTVNLYRPGYGPDGVPGGGDDADVVATQPTAGGGAYHFTGLTPGTYQVEFVPPAGYSFGPADQGADDALDSDADTLTGRTGTYTLAAGDDNTTVDAGLYQQFGTITIIKVSVPPSTQDFNFSRSFGADFPLEDDGDAGDELSNATVPFTVDPGTYTVSEDDPTGLGYALTDLRCTDATQNSGQDQVDPLQASIDVAAGETVTCTFTNTLMGTSGVTKTIVASDQTFTEDPGVTDTPFSTLEDTAIGEIIDYEVTAHLAYGEYPDASLVDELEEGLALISCSSIVPGSGVSTDLGGGFASACVEGPGFPGYTLDPPLSPDMVDAQRVVTFHLGNVSVAEQGGSDLTFTYRVVVLNSAGNHGLPPLPTQLSNTAVFHYLAPDGDDPDDLPDPATIGTGVATVEVVEPQLQIEKTASPTVVIVGTQVTYTLKISHTDDSQTPAYDVELFDPILSVFDPPVGPIYDIDCGPGLGGVTPDNLLVPTPPYIDGLPAELGEPNILHIASWSVLNLDDVAICTIKLTVNNTVGEGQTIENVGYVAWTSLPGEVSAPVDPDNPFTTERSYDPADPAINGYVASSNVDINRLGTPGGGDGNNRGGSGRFLIPVTGFAPGVFTPLSAGPAVPYQESTGVSLRIPKLKLDMGIVGVPLVKGEWKVDWLTGVGGWLQGTAYPGLPGNSVITSHVVTNYGSDGPFANLSALAVGDNIYVTSLGRLYIYKVRSVGSVAPDDFSVFKHADKPVLTLVTCSKYDAATQSYDGRLVVRAELVQVNPIGGGK